MGSTTTAAREIIRFQPGRAETVVLKFANGRECQGAGGPQFMFSTVDNRIFFLDPDIAYNLEKCATAAGQGEPITITKSKGPRSTVNWDVRPASQSVAGARPSAPAAQQMSNAGTTSAPSSLEQTLAASIEQAQARKAAAVFVAHEAPAAQAKLMAALMCAIDAAVEAQAYATRRGMALAFTSEDVRTMAATLIISADRQGGAR